MEKIAQAVLGTPVEGLNLTIGTLRDQIGEDPALLVFLRHFGCIFCRETVTDLKKAVQQDPDFPHVVFFYQGTLQQGQEFFSELWEDASYVADLPKYFYQAFELERGGLREMFGPMVWACGVRAVAKGHFVGESVGDTRQMPGVFLVRGERILNRHVFNHIGDLPDWSQFVEEGLANDWSETHPSSGGMSQPMQFGSGKA